MNSQGNKHLDINWHIVLLNMRYFTLVLELCILTKKSEKAQIVEFSKQNNKG